MAIKGADVYIPITGDNTPLKKVLNETKGLLNSWVRNIAQGIGQGIGQAVAQGVGNLIRGGINQIISATRAASDLSETLSKVNVVFRTSAREVVAWSKTAATSFGLSQQAALEATASIGNMFIQMGEGTQQAAGMSSLLVELAADIASFNNAAGGAESVLADMQSAFRGEFDPIQKYIPLINAATVQQQALAESGKANVDQLTALDKALATHTLILEGAGLAAGDFQRTLEGVANQERIAAAQLRDIQANFGQVFTPIYAELLRGFNQIIGQVNQQGQGIMQALATGMVNGIVYLLPVLRTIRDTIAYWLEAHSPPRLLPQIDEWGAATINAWLVGMTKADFGILRTLRGPIETVLRSFVGSGQIKEGDLVSKVFGTQASLARAVKEWRESGAVSAQTMQAIRRHAGPAAQAVTGLVRTYLDLQTSTEAAARAQEELNRRARQYSDALSPLEAELDAIDRAEQEIVENRRLRDIDREIKTGDLSSEQRQLLALERQRILTRRKIALVEDERDKVIEAEQDKVDAALEEQKRREDLHTIQQEETQVLVETNNLIAEQEALRKRLAAEAYAEQEKALRALEEEQRKADLANKERLAQLEDQYQASLRYNLATADTEGKIALLRLELGRYKEGSVEYFDLLTQIVGLEQQRARELEAAAGAGGGSLLPPNVDSILGKVEDLPIPEWVKELQKRLREAFNEVFGVEGASPLAILFEVPEKPKFTSMLDRLRPDAPNSISQGIKDFVDTIKELVAAIQTLNTLLSGDATEIVDTWADNTVEDMENTAEKSGRALTGWEMDVRRHIRVIQGFMDTGWAGAWTAYKENMLLGIQEANVEAAKKWTFLRSLLPKDENGEPEASDSPLINLAVAGGAIAANIATGLARGWITGLLPKFLLNLQALRDLLPGSEPEDTTSPLYDLSASGEAIINNLWAGLKSAWVSLSEWWEEKMAWLVDLIPDFPDLPPWLGGTSNGFESSGSIGQVSSLGLPAGSPTTNWGDVNISIAVTGKESPAQVADKIDRGVNEWQRRRGH